MKHQSSRKNLSIYRHYQRPYPNAAEPQYFLRKAAELVLTIVTGTGLAAVFTWMLVL